MNDHLASGDVPVQRSTIPADDRGVDITVKKMMEMARGEFGGRSAKIRALAINIINRAGVRDKDYYGMVEAVHNWVRDEIRYVKDPVGQETLSFPEETAFNTKAGDCDDKTILEIALLGALGILAYPVVVAVGGPSFSHVYLHVAMPKGKHRRAGEVIPADPIMREWPLGREAPADKVKRKKIYPHLLSGLGMLGTYADGPSYLDEENTASVQPALDRGFVSAGRDNLNPGGVQHFNVSSEGLDAMFGGAPAERVLARGPITAGGAADMTRRLSTRHKSVMAEGSFDARPEVSMVGSKDPVNPTPEEVEVISQIVDEVTSESAPGATVDGLLGAADPIWKAAAAAHYADMKAARTAWQAKRKAYYAQKRQDRQAANKARVASALAAKAQAVANKAHAKAQRLAARSPQRQQALMHGLALFAGTQGLLSDLADLNPSSEDLLTDARRTVAGLAAALPGLAGMAGPEDEQLARLGMAQSGSVLFGLSGDGLANDVESAGVSDEDKPAQIERKGNRVRAPRRIWKGVARMLGVKRGRGNAGLDAPERAVRRPVAVQRGRRIPSPAAFPKADESLLSRPTDIPDGLTSASGSAQPVAVYGPEQMGPLEQSDSVLGPVEEPRTVDAVVVPADVETPAGTVNAAEDQPSYIEGLGQMSATAKVSLGIGGLAIAGLAAYFLFLRKK